MLVGLLHGCFSCCFLAYKTQIHMGEVRGEMVKSSRKRKKKKKKKRRNPAADLTDDLIVEILSRLPVKSVCRFKCVSKHWRDLIIHPDHRWRLPQTLAGVFHLSRDSTRFPEEARHFTNVSEIRHRPLICPSLLHARTRTRHPPSGQLQWSPSSSSCNPATQSWVVLPDSGCGSSLRPARLGFDPDVSLQFYVFEFINNDDDFVVEGVQFFSCRTRAWSCKESEWDYYTPSVDDYTCSVFLNGILHLVNHRFGVVAVTVEGEVWGMLPVPDSPDGFDDYDWEPGFIGQYQGQLCFINECDYENDMAVWILKDYATGEWILKHLVSIQKLCEKMMSPAGSEFYSVITIHPDCNLVLYTAGPENTLLAYDIDHEEAWVIKHLGSQSQPPYIPYVPFYSQSLIEGHS